MPSGYRPGVQHSNQAYTKWDADRDEVEVDLRRLDQGRRSSWFSGPKGTVLKVLLILVMFLLGLIIGYVIRRSVNNQPPVTCPYYTEGFERYSADLSQELQRYINMENIKSNLRNYSSNVHITGTSNNNKLRESITQQLVSMNLRVSEFPYTVLLSYPDWVKPNTVSLLKENDTIDFQTIYHGPPHENHPELTTPYLCYSPNGTATGELMYANYGEQSDFDHLGSCQGRIVIMRYGKIFRGTKVDNAYKCGAAGVLLYPDPADVTYHMNSQNDVYDNTWYLPGWANPRGTIRKLMTGDPLSPGLPSTKDMFTISEEEADLPKIPAQNIGYDDAEYLMLHLDGKLVQDFLGAMHHNVSYKTGPGYESPRENWKVKVDVHNELKKREIRNIMAVIKGQEEPDRYVIVGVHYDAWTFGAGDPNIGTSILMEMANSMAELEKKGWKPRRSIIFMHWDAEEPGLIGSYEWVEEHQKILAERTVAYINLDRAVSGSHVLKVQASPELHNILINVTHMFPAAGTTQSTLYEQWKARAPDETSNGPRLDNVGGGSDQSAFIFTLGIPVIWPTYIHDTSLVPEYPGYHTDIDTYDYFTRFVDPALQATDVYTKFVTELVLQLSSLTRLPLDVRRLASAVSDGFNSLKSYLSEAERKDPSLLEPLHRAIANLTEVAARFHDGYQQVDMADVIEMRRFNDRAMKLSRSFIHPEGLPDRPQLKNILFAPSSQDAYAGSTFTGIQDAFTMYKEAISSNQSKSDGLWKSVRKQISIATLAVQSATSLLCEDIFP